MIRNKLTSRKFWLCLAAFLASIGATVTGIVQGSEILEIVGAICSMFSAAIYAAFEALVDMAAVDKSILQDSQNENLTDYNIGYNKAVDDVINLIEDIKE